MTSDSERSSGYCRMYSKPKSSKIFMVSDKREDNSESIYVNSPLKLVLSPKIRTVKLSSGRHFVENGVRRNDLTIFIPVCIVLRFIP